MMALVHPLMREATREPEFESAPNSSKLTNCLSVLAEAGSNPQRQYCSLLASLAKLSAAMAVARGGAAARSAKVSMAVALLVASHLCWGLEDREAAAAASCSVAVSNSSSSSGMGPAAAAAAAACASSGAVALSKLPALFMIERSCLQYTELLQAGGTRTAFEADFVSSHRKGIVKAVKKAAQWLQYRENAEVLRGAGYVPQQLLQALPDMQAAVEAVEGPQESVTAAARSAFVQKLHAAGLALTSLPTSVCCHSPGCTVVSGLAELQLVSGRGCLCAGCLAARYCCKLPCQKQHWKQHKPVCKALAAAATATEVL